MTETLRPVAPPTGRPREIWTRIAVDPLATPLALRLAQVPGVTPNRVTGLAALLAVGSALCFVTGRLRLGGALFLLRFFVDCLDGNVARAQGTSSARGAALDIAADVGGIALTMAALSSYLIHEQEAPVAPLMALLGAVVFYNWALAYRKDLARRLHVGDGGADHTGTSSIPVLRSWVRVCRRLNMSPVPWALEAEIAMLGLGPLLLPAEALPYLLGAGLAFYLLSDAVNMRRIWALTGQLDHPEENHA